MNLLHISQCFIPNPRSLSITVSTPSNHSPFNLFSSNIGLSFLLKLSFQYHPESYLVSHASFSHSLKHIMCSSWHQLQMCSVRLFLVSCSQIFWLNSSGMVHIAVYFDPLRQEETIWLTSKAIDSLGMVYVVARQNSGQNLHRLCDEPHDILPLNIFKDLTSACHILSAVCIRWHHVMWLNWKAFYCRTTGPFYDCNLDFFPAWSHLHSCKQKLPHYMWLNAITALLFTLYCARALLYRPHACFVQH